MSLGGNSIAGSVKARARRSLLLKKEDYALLLDKTSVADIALQLNRGAYASVMRGFALETMRRAELEFLLEAGIMADGVAFKYYLSATSRELLNLCLENFDIELFKNHFRAKFGTRQWEARNIEEIMEIVGDFHLTLVDKEKLFSALTLKDFLDAIKSEPLKKSLAEAVPQGWDPSLDRPEEQQKIVFSLGMILDRYYFNNLFNAISKMRGREKEQMQMLFGTRIDLMNLYWIYRGKRFFKMSPEEALTLITKVRYLLNFEKLSKLAFTGFEGWTQLLKETPYAQVFDIEEEDSSMREVQIENNIYKVLWNIVNRIFRSGELGFQTIAAYLLLKEFEVRDLVAIIEAVRYNFDKSKVKLFLIHSLDSDASGKTGMKSGD